MNRTISNNNCSVCKGSVKPQVKRRDRIGSTNSSNSSQSKQESQLEQIINNKVRKPLFVLLSLYFSLFEQVLTTKSQFHLF